MNRIKNIFSNKYIKNYEKKIKYLGSDNKLNIDNFLISRLFIEIILFIVCILIPKYGILIALITVVLFHFLYAYILLDNKIKIRSNELYDEAITFYNMLKLSLNQTHDLKVSLETISYKLDNSLALEFRQILGNNKYNNDINEVFKKVIETIPNSDVRTSLIDLKESENYDDTLDNIITSLQEKNIIITKQNYQFKPIILSFIAIILLFAIIMIVFNIYDIVDYLKNLFV